jgi:hypothetical protein
MPRKKEIIKINFYNFYFYFLYKSSAQTLNTFSRHVLVGVEKGKLLLFEDAELKVR